MNLVSSMDIVGESYLRKDSSATVGAGIEPGKPLDLFSFPKSRIVYEFLKAHPATALLYPKQDHIFRHLSNKIATCEDLGLMDIHLITMDIHRMPLRTLISGKKRVLKEYQDLYSIALKDLGKGKSGFEYLYE